jgi:hypothetical protein
MDEWMHEWTNVWIDFALGKWTKPSIMMDGWMNGWINVCVATN